MREKIEVVAKTKDEAIEKALAELGTTRDKVNVRIIDEGSRGIFGLGAKDAKIVVTMKDDEEIRMIEELAKKEEEKAVALKAAEAEAAVKAKAETEAKSKPAKKEAQPVGKEEEVYVSSAPVSVSQAGVVKEATAYVKELIAKMDVKCDVTSKIEDNNIKVVISGDDVGTVIGRRGETLNAIQYITNLYVNKGRRGDDYNRITVDTENYRAKRKETLEHLAFSKASKVVKTGRDYILEPMNPYERRIIHAALQGHKYVTTRSIGEETNRRVVITLNK